MQLKQLLKSIWNIALALLMAATPLACDFAQLANQAIGPSIIINEVVTSNGDSLDDEVYGSPDWIELKNVSSNSVSLLGYRITDNIQKADKACILPDITLAPGAFLLLFATKEHETDTLSYEGGAICLGFSLKLAGENLALEDSNMQLVQELTVPELLRDVSYARREDGTYGFCGEPTPAAENTTTIYTALAEVPAKSEESAAELQYDPQQGIVFSEVSARNDSAIVCTGCEGCDWIELYNTTAEPISMENFVLTDDPDDYDKPNLNAVLPAKGYLLIQCCANNCDTSDGHVCVRMGVNRYGDHLYLFDTHGLLCAELLLPETLKKDMTYALDETGAYQFTITPTPNEANVITEYVEIPKPTEEPEPILTGLNSKVIISEVLPSNEYSLADRDGDRSDWVELYNTTGSDITLNGWYLSDSNNFYKWAFPENTVIPANGYLLVFLSGKESGGNELHASFSIAKGETLKLFNSADYTFDQLPIEAARDNVSVGRDTEGNVVYFGEPTPLSPNGHARSEADSLGFFQSDGLFISEVCAIHERGSNEDDWIELHNGSDAAITLDGCYLTDEVGS